MLTREQILKVAHIDTEGGRGQTRHIIKLRLDYKEDSKSGDVRIVKRQPNGH